MHFLIILPILLIPYTLLADKGAIGIGLDMSAEANRQTGALIARIIPGLPAFQAGMMPGDIILEINNENVLTEKDVPKIIKKIPPGSDVEVKFLRGDKTLSLKVKITSIKKIENRGLKKSMNKEAPELFVTSEMHIQSKSFKVSKNPVNLLEDIQSPIVIMQWATWCIACKKVMPRLNSFASIYDSKAKFVLISNEPKDITDSFFSKTPAHRFPALDFRQADHGRLHIAYWTDILPTIFVVSKEGKLIYSNHIFKEDQIAKLLGELP